MTALGEKAGVVTSAERAALDAAADLWNMIVELGSHHPCDLQETCRDIHDIQNRIMARATSRQLGLASVRGSIALKAQGGAA